MEANVFTGEWDFQHEGASLAALGPRIGAELLGASVYEIEPSRERDAERALFRSLRRQDL